MMKTIKHSDIVVPEYRQRKEFVESELDALAVGIVDVGLLQPIVLQNDGKTLVAGERRYRAIEKLIKQGRVFKHDGEEVPLGYVPYISMHECGYIVVQKAELLENVQRVDLTWQEKDKAILFIKGLVEAQAQGKNVDSYDVAVAIMEAKGKDDYTTSQLYDTKSKVDTAVLREQYMDDPRVAKAKSAKEADKIIQKDLETKKRERLSEQFKDVKSPHNIVMGDCCELVKETADGIFDVICSDPIYGIGADEMHMFQRATYNTEGSHHVYDDSFENWDRMFSVMPKELYRVAKEQAALYLFCDINRFFDRWELKPGNKNPTRVKGLATRFAEAGWDVWPRPLVWYKGNIGSIPKPEHGPRYTSEYILFATKGGKKTTGIKHDVVSVPQVTGHTHGAGKPPEVYLDLLQRSAYPGDRVLDFSAGSFPILQAANTIGCTVDAWELDPQWERDANLRKNKKVGEEWK